MGKKNDAKDRDKRPFHGPDIDLDWSALDPPDDDPDLPAPVKSGRRKKKKVLPPQITFDDIGGQREAKEELQELAADFKDPTLCIKWGSRPPKGICLNGPPGNGKTLLGRALAGVVNLPFFYVRMTDIFDKWVGNSEKNVQRIFDQAKQKGGVIFFDEADGLMGSRARSTHQRYESAVLAAINTNMDGFEPTSGVVVIFATNRLGDIDEATVRAGRIDKIIQVPLPKEADRKEIFLVHMRNAEKVARRRLFEELDFDILIRKTRGFSGADIAEIVRRTLDAKKRANRAGQDPGLAITDDIVSQILKYERLSKIDKTIGFKP